MRVHSAHPGTSIYQADSDFPRADFTCVQNKAGFGGPSPGKFFILRWLKPHFFNSECSESGMTRNRKIVKTSPLHVVILAAEEAFAGETSNQ